MSKLLDDVNRLWEPNPGPQRRFAGTDADECLYGGAAGGGKSSALVAMPLRWTHVPEFRALVLRRETTQLPDLLDKASAIYSRMVNPPRYNGTDHTWTFPSGAVIWFSHCKDPDDWQRYQGLEFQWIGFDELTHFTLRQYREIRARVRSATPGLPRHVRATTNPGGPGHDWVFERWGAWLNPECGWEGLRRRARPGELLWVLQDGDTTRVVPWGTPDATSRCFIPARIEDNPRLLKEDPGYKKRLRDNDPVRQAQLIRGDWLAKPAAGKYFKRAWFPIVDAAPVKAARVRYWDRAATPDGDWTVGVRMANDRGTLYVEHVQRMRGVPGEVAATIKSCAETDGPSVTQVLEQDPGQAGLVEADAYSRVLAGHRFLFVRPTGDKIVRAGPYSAQCMAGNVRLVRGAWNEAYLNELESFPDGDYDDQVDASSGAYSSVLTAGVTITPPPAAPRRSLEGW